MSVIDERGHAPLPPADSPDWERRRELAKVYAAMRDGEDILCERCLCCDTDWESCSECGGEGYVSRYEEDPLWYDELDLSPCHLCEGKGGWRTCLGSCWKVAAA